MPRHGIFLPVSAQPMDPDDAIAQARDVGQYIGDYIKFADAKAGLILTFVAAVGAIVGATAPSAFAAAKTVNVVFAVVLLTALLVTAGSMVFVTWYTIEAIYPRRPLANASLVSFPDIAAMTADDYANKVAQLSSAQALRDYSLHNATLARIAVAKFAAISRAMWCARIALFGAYAAAVTYGVVEIVKPNDSASCGCSCSCS